MNIGKLTATIGLPRSGKSTICSKKRSENPNLVVLSGDTFRKGLYDGIYNRFTEPFLFSILDVTARSLLIEGYDVIIDETCTDLRTVMRYIAIDPDVEFCLVNTTPEECIRRALVNKQPYLVSVIEWQAKNLGRLMPFYNENFKYFRELEKERKKRDRGEPNCQPPPLDQYYLESIQAKAN